jgi:hypothetical protein
VPYCSQCGERLSPNANFCPNCGVSLAQVPPMEDIQPSKKTKNVGDYEAERAVPEKTPEPTPYPEYVAPTMIPEPVATEHVSQPVKVRTSRSTTNRIGALIFFAVGIAGICIGTLIMLIAVALITGAITNPNFFVQNVPIVGKYLKGDATTITLMILLMVLSAFHFVAGNWLYQSLKRGGILSIVITAFDIIVSIIGISLFPAIATLGYVVILLSALLMLLVIANWNSFHSEIENV